MLDIAAFIDETSTHRARSREAECRPLDPLINALTAEFERVTAALL